MNDDVLDQVGNRLGDTSDLPDVLKKQLAHTKMDELERMIVETLKDKFDGVANMDEIMVGLYRQHGYVTEERRLLNNKLYRMSKRGLIESVPKRKGVYRIK